MNDRKSIHHTQSTSLSDVVQPSLLRRRLAILTLIAYIGQPIAATAEIIAAQNAAANQRPTVDATANGLPLVQIATPSAAGVSHNQYNTFNVDPSGAILNNSAAAVSTQQAGYVVGNPNLVNGSARIILNEVTSANRSQLNGYTEVAGQRAEVIIANPNGITCNGCGFINTSRGVLTTGTPVMGVGGSLDAYRVTGGDIQIGASGLNGSNVDQLDLISRSLKVNGEIWANNLNAITGPNQINHADLGVQLISGDANKPTVGIDVALLGGMYANKITLIGTEAGVGVSSAGTLAAQAGDFTLDTQGQITLTGKTTSSGNLTLNSAAGISNSGSIDSRTNAQIKAAGEIANSGSLIAQNNLTLNGASLNSSGTLAAGIDANGNASQAGNFAISTSGASTATGTNISGGTLTINASDINLGNSLTSAQNNLALNATAGNIDLNHAQTQSIAGNVSLTSSGMTNNDYGLLRGAQITATASNLSNQGGVISATGGVTLTSQSNVDNSAGGYIGGATVSLTANNGAVNNRGGKIEADTGLTINTQSLDNSGGAIKNLSAIDAQANATILSITTMQDIINNALNGVSGFIGSNGQLTLNSIALNNASGRVYAQGLLTLTASGALSNQSGFIQTDSDLNLNATGALNNQGGTIEANGANSLFSLTAASIDNTLGGRIANSGMGLTTIDGGSQIDNTSTIGGKGDVTIITALLNNTTANARIQSSGTLALDVSGTLNNNTGGSIYAAQALNIQQANAQLNNSSADGLASSGSITIDVADINNAGGDILAVNDISLTANSYTGLGAVAAAGNNTIKLQSAFTYYAGNKFAADGNLTLDVTGNLTNQAVLQALGTLTIKAANIDNQTTGHFNSNKTDLQVANGIILNNGVIEGNTVQTSSLTLNNYATIIGDIVSLTVGDALLNSGSNGLIASTAQTNLWVSNLLHNTNGAEIFSMGDLNVAKNSTQDAAGNYTQLTSRVWNEGNSTTKNTLIEAWGNINIGAVNLDNARPTVNVITTPSPALTQHILTAAAYVKDTVTGAYTQSGILNVYSTPVQAGIFAQDISNLDTVNKSFLVAGGDPISGAPKVAYESMSLTPVLAYQYTGTVQTGFRNMVQKPTTQVIKQTDIASTRIIPGSNKIEVTLVNGSVKLFNTLDRQGMYYDVSYFPGLDPAIHVRPADLRVAPGASSTMYERWRDVTTNTTTQSIAAGQPLEAQIRASNNINLKLGGTLTNYVSTMAARNDFSINGTLTNGNPAGGATNVVAPAVGVISNQAITLTQTTIQTGTADLLGNYMCSDWWSSWACVDGAVVPLAVSNTTVSIPGGLASNLTAGGTITAHVGKSVNQAIGSNATVVGSTVGASSAIAQVDPSVAPNIDPINSGKVGDVSNIALPTSGLYSIHTQPDQQYLVVTDPRFANYKNFVSSDYMLNRLTLDPTLTQKRLGDGFYEQRLINDQILNQTGRSTLGQYASAEDQIKALMDSGVAAAQELQLTPGISLSAEQVSSLQNDIVWMEVNRVTMADGNTVEVLVPKLYLTQLHKNDLSPDGALMAASLIDINAEDGITNTGKIESTIATRLQGKDILNQGTISSAGDMMMKADNDIINKSGTISAKNLWLDAGRDVINTTATEYLSVGDSRLGASNTLIGSTGTISASNNLSMKAKRDITITGALVQAGGNASLNAGGNLNMDALQAESGGESHASNFNYSTQQITNIGSTIRTGANLSMTAANDMQLTAAQLDIGKSALIAADGNLSVTAAKDSSRLDSAATNDEGNYSNLRTYDETVVGSSINANGNITLRAGSTTNTGNARGGIEHNGDPAQGGTGKAATEQHDDAEHIESSQERIASNNGSEVILQPQITESITKPAAQTGGNLTLQSASINSKNGQVSLIASNDVTIGITEEMHDYFSESHTSSSGFLSKSSTTKRKSQNSKQSVGSEIGGESVTIRAGSAEAKGGEHGSESAGAIVIEGSSITAKEELSITGGSLSILSANDSSYREENVASKGMLSSEKKQTKHAESNNVASVLSGKNISLSATVGDMEIIGSKVKAEDSLALTSVGDINVRAGYDGLLDEQRTEKSGWFSGGSLFSKESALDGNLEKTAVLAELSGGKQLTINAVKDLALQGVEVQAANISASAQSIDLENVADEKTIYSKYEKMSVSFGDVAKALTDPRGMVKTKNGKASVTLAKATYDKTDKTTTTSTVVASSLSGDNISLNAGGNEGEGGNISITGSNLKAANDLSLTASGDVSIKDAKNTESTKSQEQSGKAEVNFVVKNEYAEIKTALDAARDSEKALEQSKASYDRYKTDLVSQQQKLAELKQSLRDGKLGIEQSDINELQGYINDLKSDEQYYKANIALAAADLATKTVAIATQVATAAAASGTYGFNAGIELNVDMLEKQYSELKQQSVASNLSAKNITIKAGKNTTIQGSNLNAANDINIDTKQLDVLAAEDINTSQSNSEHKNATISYTVYGIGGLSASAGADQSQSDNNSVTHTNSTLSGANINLKARDSTTIAGANIAATERLGIQTAQLTVASVQDSQKSRSTSSGLNLSGGAGGVSGGGANAAVSRDQSKQTVLTTLTGGSVDINVTGNTTLTGATIAAVDAEGNDTGNLSLKTGSLQVNALSNTRYSNSVSANVGVGSTVSIDASADSSHSKTKTLGTIGNGVIQIADTENSDTRLLNRDIQDNEVDIYSIESHKGLKGSLDTRLLTEDGRKSVKEDIERTKRVGQALSDVATKDAFELRDTFAHIDETQKELDVQKAFAQANGGKNIEALQGEGSTIEQKQEAIRLYAEIYAKTYGVDIESANVIAVSKVIGGTHYGNDGKSTIDINDNAQNNATDYANTMGHEVTHARVAQDKTRDRGSDKLNEEYAHTMGGYSADGMEFSATTYTTVSLDPNKVTNTHTQTAKDKVLLANNNADWRENLKQARNGNGEVDYLLPDVVKEWRDSLNQTMEENRQASADLKGDAVGTALSIAAAPADILADMANVLITTVDVSTDGLGATGMMGKDLQEEAFQNLMDMGVKADYLVENKEAIAASIAKTLKEYPDRVKEMDPSALRSIAAIVGEAAMPAGALAKMKGADDLAKVDVPKVDVPSVAQRQGPYDPNQKRADIEDVFGKENVTSTTNPNNPLQRVNSDPEKGVEVINGANGSKAVRVQYDDPITGEAVTANVPYNNRGLPVFDDQAKFTTNIDSAKRYDAQFTQATRDLRDAINTGQVDASQFTPQQLAKIQQGSDKIPGYTWHHNADSNNMQLVPSNVHKAVSHIGQKALEEGR